MSLPPLDFQFPDWKVPPPRFKKIAWSAYLDWLEENRRDLIRTGQLKKVLANRPPLPEGEPFRL